MLNGDKVVEGDGISVDLLSTSCTICRFERID